MNWLECGILLAVAIAATIALTPLAKKIAFACGAIDYPDKRRINTEPMPRMGGIAIFGGVIASIIVLEIGTNLWGWIDPFYSYLGFHLNYWLLGLGVCIMFAVGVIDDIRNLSAKAKLLGQIVSACFVASSGLLLSNIQNPLADGEFIQFGLWAYPITVFYLVAFANIINLIDGLDGLASGISAISAATIFTFSVMSSRFDAAILSVIIFGVCVGFLRFNFNPASIFMGDSGALTLGLALGIVSLLAVARSTLFISLMVPIMAAGVPVIDTAMAIIRRTRAHQPIDAPDRGHIHHRLLSAGFSQRKTVLIMWGWTLLLAACSIVIAESDGIFRVIVIIVAAAVTVFFIGKLHLLDPVLLHHYNPRPKPTDTRSDDDQ
ncbi:glycosyltransferase family 4 protein [Adlercreutzia murintestinalis]|uniref:glycosyltransferase family 4 protein n=1 Tax=Adlercreutzia murintestinalis TaxID=2941325 RepID=UPI00203D138A|nr:MraY family glycosyltransferase [Adlercreutzia murintestinalis]